VRSARKLPNGQIICINGNRQVQRLDRKGKEISSFPVMNVFYNSNEIMDDGSVLIPLGWQNILVEYNAKGKEVARHSVTQPMHAWKTPKGHTFVASQGWPYRVFELDKKGKEIRQINTGGAYVVRVKTR
jgi:hypothetical protein